MKKRIIIGLLVLLAVISLVQIPAYAGTATRYSTQDKGYVPLDATLFDLFILRPMGLAACAVGVATSVWAFPFAATTGAGAEVGDKLFTEPFEYTFTRPIGYEY
jgi:hypothetical protein